MMDFITWLLRRRPRTVAEVSGMPRLLAIVIAQTMRGGRGWLR